MVAINPSANIPKKTYVPIGRMIAVHAYPADKTKAGLVLPEGVANPMETGIALVIAVGPDCKQVKEGDEILYTHQMSAVIHNGNVTGQIHEDNVRGILIKEK